MPQSIAMAHALQRRRKEPHVIWLPLIEHLERRIQMNSKKWMSRLLITLVAAAAGSTPALARSTPASFGLPWSDRGCFSTRSDGISENTGCDIANIQFPLTMDVAGWFTAHVHAWAPDVNHNIVCQIKSMTSGDGGWVTWWSSAGGILAPPFGLGGVIALDYYSYANGAIFLNCSVSRGARITLVEW
jgi:hypothetical protein